MPLTPEQRRQKVIAAGLDPNEYDYQEPSAAIDLFNPPVEAPVAPAPQMGVMDAVMTRLKRSVGPGLAALPGMAAGGAAGTAIFPGPGTIVGGLLGGLAAGGAGAVAQEPILKLIQGEEGYQKGLERYNQAGVEHPIASVGADVIGSSIGFKPSLKSIQGLGRVAAGVPLNKLGREFTEPMINSAINTGVGGGLEAVHQGLSEEEFSPGRILTAGAASSLFNNPNALGRRLGLHGGGVEPTVEAPVNEQPTGPITDPSRLLPLKRYMPDSPRNPVSDPLGADYMAFREQLANAPILKFEPPVVKPAVKTEEIIPVVKEEAVVKPVEEVKPPTKEEPYRPTAPKQPEDFIEHPILGEDGKPIVEKAKKKEVYVEEPAIKYQEAPIKEGFIPENIASAKEGKDEFLNFLEKEIKSRERYKQVKQGGDNYYLDGETTPAGKKTVYNKVNPQVALHEVFHDLASSNAHGFSKSLHYTTVGEIKPFVEAYNAEKKLTDNYTEIAELLQSTNKEKLGYHFPAVEELVAEYISTKNKKLGKMVEIIWGADGKIKLDSLLGEENYPKFDEKTKSYYQETKGTQPNLTNEDKSFARELAAKRGVALEEPSEIISTVTGKPARGFSAPDSRIAGVSDIATRDTAPHELGGHQYLSDLQKSKLQADRIFAERGLKAAGSEEALAEAVGKRIVELEDSPLKSWVQDFWSNTKRLTRLSGDEDQIRLHSRRALQDKPFSESPEFHSSGELSTRAVPAKESNSGVKFSEAGDSAPEKAPSDNIRGITSVITQIEESGHPQGRLVGKAARGFEDDFRANTGRFRNAAEGAVKNIKDDASVAKWMYESNYGGGQTKLRPEDLNIVNEQGPLRKMLLDVHKHQKELGLKIGDRDPVSKPGYFPQMVDESVIATFSKKPGSAEAAKLKSDYIKHLTDRGLSEEQATDQFTKYLTSITNPSGHGSPEFGALREAAGMGIPWSWAEKSAKKLMSRYTNRVARDLAYYKNVQKDPVLRALFNVPDVNGSTKENAAGVTPVTDKGIQTLFKRMSGTHTLQEKTFSSIEHGIRSLILGPTTGAANAVSAIVHSMPYLPTKDIPKILEAFGQLKKGFADSMEMGVNRYHITDIESGAETGVGYYADKIKQWGDVIRKYTGSELLEQGSRAHTMMVGELAAESAWGRAMKGDVGAMAFLRKFGSGGVDYKFTPPNRQEILKIAANFTERVQGSYGPKGLPGYLLEPSSPAFWLLSLSKWSVERSNIVKQDIINPALKGDLGPLIKYTLGGLLGGAAIGEIRQAFNNRRAQTPNFEELETEGDAGDYAYKATEILNAAGYGGFVVDLLKMAADKAQGNRVKTPNIPTVDIGGNITEDLANATAAIADGQDPVKTYLDFAVNTVVNTVQAARIVNNNLNPEESERADKFTTLRVHKKLTDQPVGEAQEVNRYENKDIKEFKRAKTKEEGLKILREEILPRLAGMSKEDRLKKLKGLKRNSYQTVPADKKEAKEYYDYLFKTQGKAEADEIFTDHKVQTQVNREKARQVPRR